MNTMRILQYHIRTHTGVGPYQCAYCASSFIQKIAIVLHLKSIHKLSVCWECSAVLCKQFKFRDQASSAQRELS
ncbi:unnamed protein product [Leptidea sinapis]|uniref:C2H2-type domain-containing protein n=1 Tax=Leptidea sinapis TaxID=189913 RepID=A0A5E4QQP7_9NEOP|nr:unnamed protein product [Leptidea sinapis]